MELTKQQIQKVESYLHKMRFDYADLKHEVLDHMISDIEEKMNQEVSFEIAFENTKVKWNKHFKHTFSFYFGIMYDAPKIVIEKAKKVFWKFYSTMIMVYFLGTFFIDYFSQNSKIESQLISYFIQFVTVICMIVFSYILFKNKEVKTTYSFILKTQSMGLLIGCIVCTLFFGDSKTVDSIEFGLFIVFVFSTYSYYHFYKKHSTILKQYKIG